MRKSKKLRAIIKQAKMGKPYAMYKLGIRYELGREMPQDINKAAEWISAAADEGYAPAVEWINDYGFDDDAYVQSNS